MRKMLCVFLALVTCGVLFAGGNRDNQAAAGGKTTLRVVMQTDGLPRAHQGVIDYFAKTRPDVTVESILIVDTDYVNKTTVMLAGGDDFDLIHSKNMPQYGNMVTNAQVDDIMPRIKADNIDIAQFNGAIERLTLDGKVYGLPYRSDVWQLFYNKNLFDKAGVPYPTDNMTWPEYAEICKRLTSGSGANKVFGGIFQNWTATVQNIAIQDGKNTVISRNYEFMRPAYQMALELQDGGYIMDFGTITAGNLNYSGVFFNQQAATVYQGSWLNSLLVIEKEKNGLPFEWGVVKAPHPVGAREGQVVGTVFPMCITSRSKNKDLGWEYIKYLAGKENAMFMAKTITLPSATDDNILKAIVAHQDIPDESANAFQYSSLSLETPVNPLSGRVGTVLLEEHGLVMTKSITLDQFISNLNTRVGEILDE